MKEYSFHDTYIKWILVEAMLLKIMGCYLGIVEKLKNSKMVKLEYFDNDKFDIKNVIACRQVPPPYPCK